MTRRTAVAAEEVGMGHPDGDTAAAIDPTRFGLPTPDDGERRDWEESRGTCPERIDFIEPAQVAEHCGLAGLGAALSAEIVDATRIYQRHPELRQLAWHLHRRLAAASVMQPAHIRWPRLPDAFGEGRDFVCLHVLLSRVPAMLAFHRGRGIPHQVSLDTLDDLRLWSADHRRKRGTAGFSNPGWLTNHIVGRIFRIGRLQYDLGTFSYAVHVFRHRLDRRVVALAGDAQRFRADGQCDGANGITDPTGGFETRFERSSTSIHGHPISTRGAVLRDPVDLPPSDWECVLEKGAHVLGVHIP
ncbi:MAG: DUF5596 domain-containing protein, partial [Planctomycetes bacterium]|nr:DUF5596 domain-containing protein [Planctomycetota bacterium]